MKKSLPLSLILFLLILLASCATNASSVSPVVEIHTPLQKEALESPKELFTLLAKGTAELSKPLPVTVTVNEKIVERTFLLLSTDSSFSAVREFPLSSSQFTFPSLPIGTTYYYRTVSPDGNAGKTYSFTISPDAPRNIDVDGVTNFRDLGGWMTDSGRRVRQGLVYRSARLSENNTGAVIITEKGIETMKTELGIRTEIDLRMSADGENGNITESPLGTGVAYISLPMRSGGGYLQQNVGVLPSFFRILASTESYPLVFHCSIGTDRTGALAFVLEALLGVAEEDIYKDYLFSNFGKIEGMRRPGAIKDYIELVGKYPGETLKDRTRAFLLANGVSAEDMDAAVSILLEE